MRLSLISFSVALWILDGANGAEKKSLAPCECDSPACPAERLNKASVRPFGCLAAFTLLTGFQLALRLFKPSPSVLLET
jgi:hypothetical protein